MSSQAVIPLTLNVTLMQGPGLRWGRHCHLQRVLFSNPIKILLSTLRTGPGTY